MVPQKAQFTENSIMSSCNSKQCNLKFVVPLEWRLSPPTRPFAWSFEEVFSSKGRMYRKMAPLGSLLAADSADRSAKKAGAVLITYKQTNAQES